MRGAEPPQTAATTEGYPEYVGPWLVEPGVSGVALRRCDEASRPGAAGPDWDPVDVVTQAGGARRVVVLGESTARGWPFEPFASPTSVLSRQLASYGSYQCVDLAKVGATSEEFLTIAEKVPLLRPDIVVSFAGNNWMMPPATDGRRIEASAGVPLTRALAAGLRDGGYAGLKEAATRHALPAVHGYLDRLVRCSRENGATVVVVVTEFNLRGFVPPADIQTPVLSGEDLERWHGLRRLAEDALEAGDLRAVAGHAEEMTRLDGGCSPLPGWLAGQAAAARGDGTTARAALEQSRDSVCGLLLRYTPRVTRQVQDLLVAVARENDFPCVDLRAVLADPEIPEVPDETCFHDYCHLSDTGIERAVAAIADAVAGRAHGSTPPGPGLPPLVRAFGHARGAAHLAFQAQPADVVAGHLRAALAAEPEIASMLREVRDLLSAASPGWTDPAMAGLAADAQVGPFIGVMTGNPGLTPELWTLRECLDDLLGHRATQPSPAEVDLLVPADPDGHPLPNWTQPWAHHVGCSSETVLPFALTAPTDLDLLYELRTPWAPLASSVEISCNGSRIGTVETDRSWRRARLPIPAASTRPGVNRIRIGWPVPHQSLPDAVAADAAALERGEFPMVLPVFGELYEARVLLRR